MYQRKDFYHQKAKKEGYRARSTYKLLELNKKFKIINKHDKVLDLGCAPGGWLQAVKKILNNSGIVIGVDLENIKAIKDVIFIKGDILEESTKKKIYEHSPFNVVLSDMAPKTSGQHHLDVARSIQLSEMALDIAKEFLQERGNFCCKVFQGKGYDEFLEEVKTTFQNTKTFVPKSTRKNSREIYVIGMKKL